MNSLTNSFVLNERKTNVNPLTFSLNDQQWQLVFYKKISLKIFESFVPVYFY